MNAPGYNQATSVAMYFSQWAHLFFLWNWYSYDKYLTIQNWLYRNRKNNEGVQ